MTKSNQQGLFAEFPPVSTSEWETVIATDLKGADYERKLVWKSNEGFNVRPYYRAENLEGINFLNSAPGEFPFVRGISAKNNWDVHQRITVKCVAEANAKAKTLISKRVNSVEFCISEALDQKALEILLDGVDITKTMVVFSGTNLVSTANALLDNLDKSVEESSRKAIKAAFCIDPMVKDLSCSGEYVCGGDGEKCYDAVATLVKRANAYKHIRVITVSGDNFGNSGSTIVEELAFTLAAGHEYLVRLMQKDMSIEVAARTMRFAMSISSNYFMEIAKIRAARLLWSNIVAEYSPKCPCIMKMRLHAVTSKWNQTAYDPHVNMLRGTTEAMSAAIAGVDSLEVLPYDTSFQTPDEFSERIARNAELLLKYESHFDQVADAAGGSYYIENLTQSIAEQAWALFVEIEQKGGYVETFNSGYIVDRVKASAAAKDKAIATRRKILLGANQYPNFTETASAALKEESVEVAASDKNCLTPYRGSMSFESMRLGVDRSGKEPKAFMLTCGNLAMARARSQFSCNFFGCAGIKVVDNTYFTSVEQGVEAALEAKADIVVICAGDDDYTTLAPRAAELLAGKAIFVVAGAPACAEELKAQGIGNFINVKSNVLETLKFYLKEMGI
ncbi:MAG: methylmalonyl-CoA mutase family protein [Rikenellaceae bacterium]